MEVINFSADNIIPEAEVEQLLNSNNDTVDDTPDNSNNENEESSEEENSNKNNSAEDLTFDDNLEFPENVGGEEDNNENHNQDNGENSSQQEDNTSPNQNFYSSITNALAEDGVFSNLDSDEIAKIQTPEDFSALIDKQIESRFDERQKRIEEALNNNVPTTEIQAYEQTLNGLSSINDEMIEAEGEQGETIRKNLIYQDYINKGFSTERAAKEVQKSLDSGLDIEDAKESLQSCIDFYNQQYQKLIKDAKAQQEQINKERDTQIETIKSSIMNDKNLFGGLDIDNNTRKRAVDNITKATFRDEKTGNYLTAIQKYELEHKDDFLKNLGLIYTLTDGFKNFDKFIQGKVKKEMKKGIRNLENVINNTSRGSDGLLKFAGQYAKEDDNSFIGKGWQLNL